jgi:hypothetical protein
MDKTSEPKGFRIEDKRKLGREAEQAGASKADRVEEQAGPASEGGADDTSVSFVGFLLSLHASALLHLGKLADPRTGLYAQDLLLAKQTIDILGIIQEKTQGNLAEDESALLNHILYELRLEFVKTKTPPKES